MSKWFVPIESVAYANFCHNQIKFFWAPVNGSIQFRSGLQIRSADPVCSGWCRRSSLWWRSVPASAFVPGLWLLSSLGSDGNRTSLNLIPPVSVAYCSTLAVWRKDSAHLSFMLLWARVGCMHRVFFLVFEYLSWLLMCSCTKYVFNISDYPAVLYWTSMYFLHGFTLTSPADG